MVCRVFSRHLQVVPLVTLNRAFTKLKLKVPFVWYHNTRKFSALVSLVRSTFLYWHHLLSTLLAKSRLLNWKNPTKSHVPENPEFPPLSLGPPQGKTVCSGEERGLISRTAAVNRAYFHLVYTHSAILVIQAIWLVSYLGLWRYIHRFRRWI